MSVSPKTQERIARIVMAATSMDAIQLARAVELTLKEQDRDTRHACAEAVSEIVTEGVDLSVGEVLNRAHRACMNVQAV